MAKANKSKDRFPLSKKWVGNVRAYAPPRGKLGGSFEELQAAGCIQCENENCRALFPCLMQETRNNVCDGCPVWERLGPKCEAFRKYHTAFLQAEVDANAWKEAIKPHNLPEGHEHANKSIEQLGKLLGLGIRATRRLKQRGELVKALACMNQQPSSVE